LNIAAGVAAFALLAVLIVVLVGLLRGGENRTVPAEMAGTTGTTASPPVATRPEAGNANANSGSSQSARNLTIRAQDSVTLIIDQVDPAERLYQGTLTAGDVIPIEKQGQV